MKRTMKTVICAVLALTLLLGGTGLFTLAEDSNAGKVLEFTAMVNSRGVDDSATTAQLGWLEKVQELMGVEVKINWNYVPNAEYDDKMKVRLTSGDLPDYFLMPFLYNFNDMANEGYFLDFAKYDMPNYNALVDKAVNGRLTATMADGKMPVLYQVILPLIEEDKMPLFQNNAVWNYTAFERDGIAIPATLDELYEAAKAFKELYPASYPINTNYQGVFAVFHAYHMYANLDGAGTLYWNGDGYTFAGQQEQYRDAVEYLRKLVTEDLFDPEYIIDTVDTIKTKMLTEQNFMLLNAWRTHATEYTRESMGEFVFTNAFVPDNPEYGKAWQQFGKANQVELTGWTLHAVNADFAEPELMTQFLDLQFLPEVYEFTSWGVEGVTYTVDADGNKKFIDEFYEEGTDPSLVADTYGLWNDRSGRAMPGMRLLQDNFARESSFKIDDYNYFDGKYEEAPTQYSEYFLNTPWPNEYIPPHYDTPPIQLTEEENLEASRILTEITTYTKEMQAAFIAGDISMDEWDGFMEKFNGYELQTVLDIYNAAAKRVGY